MPQTNRTEASMHSVSVLGSVGTAVFIGFLILAESICDTRKYHEPRLNQSPAHSLGAVSIPGCEPPLSPDLKPIYLLPVGSELANGNGVCFEIKDSE